MGPVALHGFDRHVLDSRDLFQLNADEKSEFHHLGLSGIQRGQFIDSFVDSE